MYLTAPDDVFTSQEAADYLRKSRRQVQRLLTRGLLEAARPNGRWVISAVSLWRYLGILDDMMRLWERRELGDYSDER
jgi:excisionase family DNA binding protein